MTKRRSPVLVLVLLAAAILALLLQALPRVTRFSQAGLSFDVPSSWTVHDQLPPALGFGQTIALIGTAPWGPCAATDINCHYQERLGPHEIEISIEVGSLLGTDFCSYARDRPDMEPRSDGVSVVETHYFRVDSQPAISTYYSLAAPDYYLSDGWRKWEIEPIGATTELYRISAKWRGPGDQELLDALDQLIASVHLGPSSFGSVATDCGEPFPPARSLAPGETATPIPTPTPTPVPEPRIDCHGDAEPLPSMLQTDPCPNAIVAVELAVAPVRLPIERIVLEPGPFYCDLIWPGGQSAGPCFGPMVRPGQYMHGWVWFRGSDKVAAVMLGLDLPDDLDQPGATRPPWHATLVATEVPPAGFVVQ